MKKLFEKINRTRNNWELDVWKIGRKSSIYMFPRHQVPLKAIKKFNGTKKYYKPLVSMYETHNSLLAPRFNEKSNEYTYFAHLILIRLEDYFDTIIYAIANNKFHAIYSLLRCEIETLAILKYMQKDNSKIQDFIENEEYILDEKKLHPIHINDMIKAAQLEELYGKYSNIVHPNPISLKKYHS